MRDAPTTQFSVRLAAIAGDAAGPEIVEELALALREELADAGASRVEPAPAGEAPPGTRGLAEILGVCAFVITVVQTGESVGKVVTAVRRVAARFARRNQRVQVTLAGVEVDLATASDDEIVRAVLARPGLAATGVRRALVVTNARYDDPGLAQLRAPGHDGEALVRVLGDPAIGGFDVELLQDGDERTIRRRIAAFFADRDRDDVLLLHFSCHGVKDPRGRLHLAARDTELALLGATAIPASFIHDQLAMTQSRRVVLILDCCYSGAFARGTAVRGGGDVQLADELGAGAGRIVLTASSATEYAFEGGELTEAAGQPSAFTGALAEGLQTGDADLDADGEITVDELYAYAYRAVRAATPGQVPMKWSFGAEGNLVVARSRRRAALPGPLTEDLRSERVPLRLEAVNELAALRRGDKPGLREAALAALTELRDNDDSARVRSAAADALAGRAPAPDSRTTPAEPSAPTTSPAAAPPGRARGLLLTSALLVLLSLLLYAVAAVMVAPDPNNYFGANWHFSSWVWAVELVAAGLLLVTRQARWAGLLVGMLAWEWLNAPLIWQTDIVGKEAGGFYITGNFVALVALVCAMVALVRRPARVRELWRRAPLPAVVAVLCVATVTIAAALMKEYVLFLADRPAAAWVAAGFCSAVVLPIVCLTAPTSQAARLAPVGWLVGGVWVASVETRYLGEFPPTELIWLWIFLLVTATAAFAAVWPRRATPEPVSR